MMTSTQHVMAETLTHEAYALLHGISGMDAPHAREIIIKQLATTLAVGLTIGGGDPDLAARVTATIASLFSQDEIDEQAILERISDYAAALAMQYRAVI